jgi:uncharacterized membrane protein YbhN (UPF0104 family)
VLQNKKKEKLKNIFKFLKKSLSNILFIFFIFAFVFFILNNKSELEGLFNFNLYNLILLNLFFIASTIVKAKLNQYIYLTKDINLTFSEALNLIVKSTAANLSIPLNIGTGYKFYYLKKFHKLSYSENFSINIYYSIFTNLIYLIILIAISYINYLYKDPVYLNFIPILTLFFISGLLFLLLLFKYDRFQKIPFLKSYSFKSLDISISIFTKLLILTILLITISVFSYLYLFSQLDLDIEVVQIISFVCISGVANIIKFTPGNFGINEGVLIIANIFHGLTALQVIVVSLIFRFFSWLNIIILYSVLNFQEFYNKNHK